MDDPAPPKRRITLGSFLIAGGAFWALEWIGRFSSRIKEVFAQVKVPIPALTLLLVSIPYLAWLAGGLLFGALICLKDLRMEENRARSINVIVLALLFLFVIGSLQVLLGPQMALLEGIGGRR